MLIANPPSFAARVYICDECISVCHSVLSEQNIEDRFKRGQ
jgi:hypothetical protein